MHLQIPKDWQLFLGVCAMVLIICLILAVVVVAGKYEAVDVEDKELPPGRDVSQHCMLTCQSLLLLCVYSVTVDMPQCACASEVYGSVVWCVCACACV